MEKREIINPSKIEEDFSEKNIRPEYLNEYVGQNEVKRRI